MAALKNSPFREYLSVQQLFVILPYSPFPYLPTKVVKFLQSVCILSGIIEGEGKKIGPANASPIGIYTLIFECKDTYMTGSLKRQGFGQNKRCPDYSEPPELMLL